METNIHNFKMFHQLNIQIAFVFPTFSTLMNHFDENGIRENLQYSREKIFCEFSSGIRYDRVA